MTTPDSDSAAAAAAPSPWSKREKGVLGALGKVAALKQEQVGEGSGEVVALLPIDFFRVKKDATPKAPLSVLVKVAILAYIITMGIGFGLFYYELTAFTVTEETTVSPTPISGQTCTALGAWTNEVSDFKTYRTCPIGPPSASRCRSTSRGPRSSASPPPQIRARRGPTRTWARARMRRAACRALRRIPTATRPTRPRRHCRRFCRCPRPARQMGLIRIIHQGLIRRRRPCRPLYPTVSTTVAGQRWLPRCKVRRRRHTGSCIAARACSARSPS